MMSECLNSDPGRRLAVTLHAANLPFLSESGRGKKKFSGAWTNVVEKLQFFFNGDGWSRRNITGRFDGELTTHEQQTVATPIMLWPFLLKITPKWTLRPIH